MLTIIAVHFARHASSCPQFLSAATQKSLDRKQSVYKGIASTVISSRSW
jgi:hypothetical protein